MEEELKFEDIINVLRSRKKIIIMSIIFVTLLSIVYSFLKSPVYEAKVRVRLPGSSQVTEFFFAGMTNPWNDVLTQLEIIKSINAAKRVINKLGLRFRVLDKKMPSGLTIDSIYVKENMPSGDFILKVYRNYYLVKNLPGGKIYIKGQIKTYHEEKGSGLKVLLIDGDSRRATLHDIFNVPREPGFSDLLVGHQAKAFETQIKNLYLLPAGARILPSLDLLNPVNVNKLKEKINHHYDVVIVDTPPILPVAEALSISSLSDATTLVVRSEYTDKNILQDVAQQLKRSNVNSLGTVLNAFNFENYGDYVRRYYYEYYGRSGVAKTIIFNKIINQIKKMEDKP